MTDTKNLAVVVPNERLEELKQRLKRWRGIAPDRWSVHLPDHCWSWNPLPDGSWLIGFLATSAAGEVQIEEMHGVVGDAMHDWAQDRINAATAHLTGHRYLHTAGNQEDCWEAVVNRWPTSRPFRGLDDVEFHVGKLECRYMEHPWGEVVAHGPKVEPLTSLLIVAQPGDEDEFRARMRELQAADASYVGPGRAPSIHEGKHRAMPIGKPKRRRK